MEEQPHTAPIPERPIVQIGIFLPVISLPMLAVSVVWSLVRRRPEARPWRRYLMGLLAVDMVVATAVVLVLQAWWGGVATKTIEGPVSSAPRRVIGIQMKQSGRVRGAGVAAVLPGSPAHRVGIKPGDVVVAVDGIEVIEARQLPRLLQSPDERRRTLRIRRGGQILEKVVVPVESSKLPRAKTAIFDAPAGESSCSLDYVAPVSALEWVPQVATFAVLLLLGLWRRITPRGLWVGVMLLPGASMTLGLVSVVGLCHWIGGRTLGGSITGMIVGETLLLFGSLAVLMILRRGDRIPRVLLEPRLSLPRALGLGAGYMLGGGLRVGILIAGGGVLLLQAGGALQLGLSSAQLGSGAIVMLALLGVVIAPVAEELYFRGVLLPWLSPSLGAWPALWVSSILFGVMHLHYGVNTLLAVVYGVVLGWARMRSGGLWAPFILHGTMNLLAGWALLSGG